MVAVNSKDKSEPVEPLLESVPGRDVENFLVKSINFCLKMEVMTKEGLEQEILHS